MPESPTEMMEKIRLMQTDTALHNQSIHGLTDDNKLQWEVIEKIKESLSTIKAQIAAFGVINSLVLAWIAYKLTKGL